MHTFCLNKKKISLDTPNNPKTIYTVSQDQGIKIPAFCYHPCLSIAGNCRMCLVEVDGTLVASCATPVRPNIQVLTHSPKVIEARKNVLSLLLINHPLDCPVCDQGGECDLQNFSYLYGSGRSTYPFPKRQIEDEDLGPYLSTTMNRCIHCTRCIRFSQEISGTCEWTLHNRGDETRVRPVKERFMTSELSANVIDVCPVGALNAKPWAYQARPWELTSETTIDVHDALCGDITVDLKAKTLHRVRPPSETQWITNTARFATEGLRYQRLSDIYIRHPHSIQRTSNQKALKLMADKLQASGPKKSGILLGDTVNAETLYMAKKLWSALKSPWYDCRSDGMRSTSYAYAHGSLDLAALEHADCILLIGAYPHQETPLLTPSLLRKATQEKCVWHLGHTTNEPYVNHTLGHDPGILTSLPEHFLDAWSHSTCPVILLGHTLYHREDIATFEHWAHTMTQDKGKVCVLHRGASRPAGLALGLCPSKRLLDHMSSLSFLYLVEEDNIDFTLIPQDCFVVYQGSHADKGVERADLILPSAAYTEQRGTYKNLFGEIKHTSALVPCLDQSQPSWSWLLTLGCYMNLLSPTEEDTLSHTVAHLLQSAKTPKTHPKEAPQSFSSDPVDGRSPRPYHQAYPLLRVSPPLVQHTPSMQRMSLCS